MLGQGPLGFSDLFDIDPAFARSFQPIYDVAQYKNWLNSQGLPAHEDDPQLCVNGCPLEYLCLDFTLPGYSNIELVQGGSRMTVTVHNVGNYAESVLHYLLNFGIYQQLRYARNQRSFV